MTFEKILTYTQRWFHAFKKDPYIFFALIIGVAALFGVAEVIDDVLEGDSHAIDEYILLLLRDAGNPDSPWGPHWLEEMMRDITGLGGTAVLTFVTLAAAAYLVAIQRKGQALYLFCVAGSGMIVSNLLKMGIDRPRPDLVPHGSITYLPSFPSGHSLISAVVYLTLGALLAETQSSHRLKLYFLSLAAILVVLIGFSRVYLGVHWPSDVVAGWLIGVAWATLFWALERFVTTRS